jgi:hypothetical protein
MSSYSNQVVSAARSVLIVLLVLLFFFSAARAQMNDSGGALGGGGLGGGAMDGSGSTVGSGTTMNAPDANSDSDSENGPVNNTMRRGCADPNDPNSADSGLPPCTNSDDSSASGQGSQGGQETQPAQSTLSGGSSQSTLSGGAPVMRGVGQGFANTISRQSMANVVQQLGISPDELGSLKNEMASGGLSPDDMQELCLHFAAKQLSANDVAGIAKSLGLNFTDQQLAQLRSCTGLAGEGGSDENASPAQQMGMTPSAAAANLKQPASSVEAQFRGRAGRAKHPQSAAIRLLAVYFACLDVRSCSQRPGQRRLRGWSRRPAQDADVGTNQ